MSNYQPYKYWTRERLLDHVANQCEGLGKSDLIPMFWDIIFDSRWNPIEDYNGCNLIQDKLHPFPPCLKHDFDWMVLGGGVKYDREFMEFCKVFGETPCKARLNFVGVRIGWMFYYKWQKIWKRYKNKKWENKR